MLNDDCVRKHLSTPRRSSFHLDLEQSFISGATSRECDAATTTTTKTENWLWKIEQLCSEEPVWKETRKGINEWGCGCVGVGGCGCVGVGGCGFVGVGKCVKEKEGDSLLMRMELFSIRRWMLVSAQRVNFCVYKIIKYYTYCITDWDVWLREIESVRERDIVC